ncbi:erythromycin biosynthesis sensory transduction protein eryC1 [Amycolatopsis antarctica]|uniref:Erythromycin biosynthesis sensory transduction protein eryC1 n=1 Tax=Amycolatopsis antarctica TaxID=1854586 RepID=A0A263D355_9PSEU|nr:DegT/DnrJ/EryC1/StrS family aminotransferase [Amycolatopsis antarctica]OZM72639.1 erythromycin biosynthesis sensory transduction protein eryC1 [Amycolatopsis antarctica]
MNVPFLDLHAGYAELRGEIDAAVARVLDSGRYLLGPENAAFEAEFAEYSEAGHCVTVGSGCDALELALRALGIGEGDEVIVPSHTFIATWLAVSETGAVPVPVEPDERTATLDPARIEAAITPRTEAIIPVHLYGHPADLAAVEDVAGRHGLAVLADAAQAHGARHRGRRIGGGLAAFSFYPGKNLGAFGDGGAVTTDDASVAERLRLLRNYGSKVKYQHEVQATNSRLDEIQAATLRVKLRHLDRWNARRAEIAKRYADELAGLPDLALPVVEPWAEPVWHLFTVRSPRRDEIRESLAAQGIETLIHYPVPPHLSGAYRTHPAAGRGFPVAERLAAEVFSLPIGPHLGEEQVDAVVTAVRAACR